MPESGPDRELGVLVVDDDHRLTEAISRYLSRRGYAVTAVNSGQLALDRFAEVAPDLVILDVMMPGKDGWEVCRKLRERSSVPIIMLTARDQESDRVMGLRMGADDYVGKPFSLKELEARAEAVLRRSTPKERSGPETVFDDGHLRMERGSMQVSIEEKGVSLTATERKLLFHLAEHPDEVLSSERILRNVWGPEYQGQSDYVKLYIWRLRQKIEPAPSKPRYIKTVRGMGYRFES